MKKTYELNELTTDAWVEALSNLDDKLLDEALEIAEDERIIKWARYSRCPAELDSEHIELAKKYNYRFDENGNVVSHD